MATEAATEARRGQTLISFCLCLPLAVVGVGAFAWLLLTQLGTAWLDLEAYSLARAHLYGNALGFCQGRELERLNRGPFKTSYECSNEGTLTGHIVWNQRTLITSRWNLVKGVFERR